MNTTFDHFGQPEFPYIVLCNPSKEKLYSLGLAYNTKIITKFNALSEFSFDFPKSIDGGSTNLDAFSNLKNKKLVLVEGFGYFQITDVELDLTGSIPIAHVTSQSLESELIQKRVTIYSGTKPLYNILSPNDTILQDMIELAPGWSVGNVDSELLVKYRTFDVKDSNIYGFLMNDVAKAFECIFTFDTENKTISATAIENATTDTDIFMSFDNLISKASLVEKSDEITTSLSVFGDGNLSIAQVNPLGTSKIYNFDYYANSTWMSSELVSAINSWKALVETQQPVYADNLAYLQTYNSELIVLQSELVALEEEYLVLEETQGFRIQAGLDYSDINAQLSAKQSEINSKQLEIDNKTLQISNITDTLLVINQSVSFQNNFTESQLIELSAFTFENTYRNEFIIQTDSMTPVEIQSQAQELYDQSLRVLEKVSTPRYEFSLESVNFTNIPEFQVFTSQLELGCLIRAEVETDYVIISALLEIEMSFDDPSDFSMVFSNRLRLDDGKFMYSDLMGEVVKTGGNVAFDSSKWANWSNDYKDSVTTFITSSLNAATNSIISNENQDILINRTGLRARQSDGAGGYENKQAWLVNNILAFSDDGFQTSKLALGEISLPAGGTAYGLVGEVIVGRILAGNTLTIENETNNFILDSTGATLNNANFTVQTTNTKIDINPTGDSPFVIQKNEGGTFVNKFRVTGSGDVIFSGTLSGADGTFSGTISASVGNIGTLVIDSQGLKTSDGVNYLRGDGTLKWGGLSITPTSATFTGNIYADKLVGAVSYSQLTDIPVNKLLYGGGYGTLSGSSIYGGSMYPGSVNASSFSTFSGGIGTSFVSATGGTSTFGNLTINGSISVSGGTGLSTSRNISTNLGYRVFTWSRGILVSVS